MTYDVEVSKHQQFENEVSQCFYVFREMRIIQPKFLHIEDKSVCKFISISVSINPA